MKSQIKSTYDRTNKLYNIRIRTDDEGFQDEIVLQFKPDDNTLLTGTLKVLKDTTKNSITDEYLPYTPVTLLNLMLNRGD